ncbi:RNA methyltransferase [Flavobacteriales bacterium 33_180_T64]|nr:RNA methyltransferase [Flavobacteriales bacterium 33_180_T64]
MQLNHYASTFKKHTFPITLVCENVTNAPNIGSLFRTADAFGIEQLIFCGEQIPLGRKMTKTSRATEKHVNHDVRTNISEVILELKSKGYFIIALEITTKSKALVDYKFPKNKAIAIIIGDENFGVSKDMLEICDDTIHINMYGQNSSMNVVQATSVTLYEITKQIK